MPPLREHLEEALALSWGPDTCHPEQVEDWNPNYPWVGQADATALVVRAWYGGYVLYCHHTHHWWNRVPDLTEYDATGGTEYPPGTRHCPEDVLDEVEALELESSKQSRLAIRHMTLSVRVERHLRAIQEEEHGNPG